ncbi:MAG: rod shape-determining protein MreD [Sphingomonadaceae bacterium]
MIASMLAVVVVIASTPLMPPLGFMMFLAWRQLRPGLLPVWAGLPLGMIDDIFSGQPIGSAIFLWSIAAIALDVVEARLPWRNFLTEWLLAAGMLIAYIGGSLALANMAGAATPLWVTVPQIAISILVYPLFGRLVALFDRLRLTPFIELR